MEIINLAPSALKPYAKNAKKHPPEQIDRIVESISQFGFVQPVVIDKDNVIVIGHGRVVAAKRLGLREVPCVLVDTLTPAQVNALRLADNKTNESAWDVDLLSDGLLDVGGIDMTVFGFDKDGGSGESIQSGGENPYSKKAIVPQYEIAGDDVSVFSMIKSETKMLRLIKEIEESGVTQEEKEFLLKAASRHIIFDYRNIAEYYAAASQEMQKLMENSALVIIDFDDAIANGYVKLSGEIAQMMAEDVEDAINGDDEE